MSQETSGKIAQVRGRIKELAGIVSGNRELEKKGARQRAAGSLEEGVGRVRRKVGDAVADVATAIKK